MRYALFVALTLLLTAFIGWGTYQTALLLRTWKPDRNLLLIPAENAVRLAMILAAIGLGMLSGLPPTTLGWASAEPAMDLAIGIVAGVLLSLSLTPLSKMAVRRWGHAVYSPIVMLNVLPTSGRQWLLVSLALIPAVLLEELLFRSLLLGGLSPMLPVGVLAVGLSLVFGLLHLPQGKLGVLGTAAAGLVFSLLFIWRGTLLAPLAAHYAADVLQLVQASRSRAELTAMQS